MVSNRFSNLHCEYSCQISVLCFIALQCVDSFIADFKTKPKYKAAYVYFTDCKYLIDFFVQ